MRIAIMQPYFFPYIGYFQLMSSAHKFVVYDNIEYTKKGWFNRNRILKQGNDALISLPLQKASDKAYVIDRYLSLDWLKVRKKMLNMILESYRKAPFFEHTYALLESCIMYDDTNLFRFNLNTLKTVQEHLSIHTEFVVSSNVSIDHRTSSQAKVISICTALKATEYINPLGGAHLYSKSDFNASNLELLFLKPTLTPYVQMGQEFLPGLSIIDVMMFNPLHKVKALVSLGDVVNSSDLIA